MSKIRPVISKPLQDSTRSEPAMLCGRRITIHPDYTIQANHQGATLYFCTESCLNAFRADPQRFYCAHSKTAPE